MKHTLPVLLLALIAPLFLAHAQHGWQRVHPYPDGSALTDVTLEAVHFIDAIHGVIVGEKGTVLRTDDGANWQKLQLSYPDSLFGHLYAVTADDAANLYAAGAQGIFYASSDNGASWTERHMDVEYDIASLHFVAPSTIWAVGDSGAFGQITARLGCIRKSDDGGRSWRTVATMDTWTAPGLGMSLRDIQFTSHDTGYIVGERGVILKTVDGGEHWDFLYTEQRTHFYAIHFFSNDQGFCTGESSSLWYTDNGGATWSEERQRWGYFNDLAFVNRMTGFGCGSGIQRSTDGGRTWNFDTLSSESRPSLEAMCFVDDQEAWAVGRNGVIFHTESGGLVSAETVPTVRDVDFNVFPQPILRDSYATIRLTIPVSGSVQLELFDLLGHRVIPTIRYHLEAGIHDIPFPPSHTENGILLLHIQINNNNSIWKALSTKP